MGSTVSSLAEVSTKLVALQMVTPREMSRTHSPCVNWFMMLLSTTCHRKNPFLSRRSHQDLVEIYPSRTERRPPTEGPSPCKAFWLRVVITPVRIYWLLSILKLQGDPPYMSTRSLSYLTRKLFTPFKQSTGNTPSVLHALKMQNIPRNPLYKPLLRAPLKHCNGFTCLQ